jgi:STE24 endopeptidase
MGRCVSTHRFFIAVLLCCAALTTANSAALAAQNRSSAPAASEAPASAAPLVEQTPTEQYTLSHERYEKAVAYSRAGYTLYFVSVSLGLLVLFLLLRLGVAAKLRNIAEDLTDKRWVQCLVFVPLLVAIVDLSDLPVGMYWHSLSLHYEQSIQGWGSWLWDWTKSELLTIGFSCVVALILLGVMRRSPRRWWLYFWFASLPIILGLIFITPLVVDPLFNKFEPLSASHPDLVKAIEKLTERAGVPIPAQRIFLMEASQKTNQINAYVTGLGASKRVVVWDTTIQKMSTEETLFVVGHELGHYVLGHVRTGFLYSALGSLLGLYLLFRGLHWSLDRWGADWKIYGPEDWASLAALLLLFECLMFLASPVISSLSRMQEHAADVYGLEIIHGVVPHSAQVAAEAFQKLGEQDLSDPNPPAFITFWLYSHPPLADRLVFAHSYDPWSKGQSPKYVKPPGPAE